MDMCDVVLSREIWLNIISELRPCTKIYQRVKDVDQKVTKNKNAEYFADHFAK